MHSFNLACMSKIKNYRTLFLFGKRNYIIGAGNLFNLAGTYFKYDHLKNAHDADLLAIQNDWDVVGKDLRKAMDKEVKK